MTKTILAGLLLILLFAQPAVVAAKKPPSYEKPPKNEGPGRGGKGTYLLVEKSGPPDWEIVGGKKAASGKVTYNLSGSTFDFELKAEKLEPNRQYRIDLIVVVDGLTYYSIASVTSDRKGKIRYKAKLSEFADSICVSSDFTESTTITSGRTYTIMIHVKYDGSPPSGEDDNGLACSGNGDGNFEYVLFEFLPLTFTGE